MNDEMGLFQVMYSCRAMRRLRREPVPEAVLLKLVEAGNQAPSGSNLQLARWIVVRDPGVRAELAALNKAAGLAENPPVFASLAQDVSFKPRLTCYLPVKLLSSTGGQILAMPVHTNTSGDFAALSGRDGYVELPLDQSDFPAGTAARLQYWSH